MQPIEEYMNLSPSPIKAMSTIDSRKAAAGPSSGKKSKYFTDDVSPETKKGLSRAVSERF